MSVKPPVGQGRVRLLEIEGVDLQPCGVLPYAKSGIVSAAMLGLGRALGETMAVAMVLSPAA